MELIYAYIDDMENYCEKLNSLEEIVINQNYKIEIESNNSETINLKINLNSVNSNIFNDISKMKNVRNITGIVGENGCGKTTLLRFLHSFLNEEINGFIIYSTVTKGSTTYLYEKSKNFTKKILVNNSDIDIYNNTYKFMISNSFDNSFSYFNKKTFTPESTMLNFNDTAYINSNLFQISTENTYSFPVLNYYKYNTLIDKLSLLSSSNVLNSSILKNLIPTSYFIYLKTALHKSIINNDLVNKMNPYRKNFHTKSLQTKSVKNILSSQSIANKLLITILLELTCESINTFRNQYNYYDLNFENLYDEIINIYKDKHFNPLTLKNLILEYILRYFNVYVDDKKEPPKKISSEKLIKITKATITKLFNEFDIFYSLIKKYDQEKYCALIIPGTESIESKQSTYSPIFNITTDILSLEEYISLTKDIHDFIAKSPTVSKYIELNTGSNGSTGEEALVQLFSLINKCILTAKDNHITLLIDEIDTYIHPRWQVNLINDIFHFIDSFDCSIEIIFTSHSPLVLSDLPNNNLIFLTKNINIAISSIKSNTFGANIHNLYKDSFFLDNTIGKFASKRITECIEFLTDYESFIQERLKKPDFENKHIKLENIEEKQKEIEYIISIIGEPIIKNKLEKMYNKVFSYNEEYYRTEYRKLLEEKNRLLNKLDSSSIDGIMNILDKKITELKSKAGVLDD